MESIKNVPVHVSIIMDGNGRWARERNRERVFGHSNGVESVRACVEAAAEEGVRYLSLFAFSEENWARPESEVNTLMELMMKSIAEETDSLAEKGIRFIALGNLSRLEAHLREAIHGAELKTMPPEGKEPRMTLIVFLSYSGKWDIMQASAKLAQEYSSHPQDLASAPMSELEKHLVTAGIPDPDLLIRTSGEQRISNYLLWQCAYSEFLFVDKMWPDFRKEDFRAALAAFSNRDRRYGKVK
ncbi:MAG: polyprenyl diphosphate synthase [Bacteroidales bacterium]|nr:polyprenyl diphosphate synthase [Bacteroidales bacterium]